MKMYFQISLTLTFGIVLGFPATSKGDLDATSIRKFVCDVVLSDLEAKTNNVLGTVELGMDQKENLSLKVPGTNLYFSAGVLSSDQEDGLVGGIVSDALFIGVALEKKKILDVFDLEGQEVRKVSRATGLIPKKDEGNPPTYLKLSRLFSKSEISFVCRNKF